MLKLPSVRTKSIGRHTLRSESNKTRFYPPLLTAAIFVVAAILSGYLSINRETLLPSSFGNDAQTILNFIAGKERTPGSYLITANIYDRLELERQPAIAGLLGVGLSLLLALIALIQVGGLKRGLVAPLLLVGYILLSGVFVGTYSKEIVIVTALAIILALPRHWLFEIVVVAVLLLIGFRFREYWLILAAGYVGFRIFRLKWMRPWLMIVLIALVSIVFSLAIFGAIHVPADHFRSEVNAIRTAGVDAQTLIPRYVDAVPEPYAGILNNLLTTAFLMIPIPLLKLGGFYYVFSFALFAVLSMLFLIRVDGRKLGDKALAHRTVSIIAAMYATQGLFEPDFGSALRHLTPFIPFFLVLWSLPRVDRAGENPVEFAHNSITGPNGASSTMRVEGISSPRTVAEPN